MICDTIWTGQVLASECAGDRKNTREVAGRDYGGGGGGYGGGGRILWRWGKDVIEVEHG